MLSFSRCVVVLGVHRSGTSAIAGVLHHLGINMGTRLLPPDVKNIKGYFEDLEFSDLHHKMIVDWLKPKDDAEFYLDKYAKLISDKSKQTLWGLKDPKLCLLMPYFTRFVKKSIIINVNRSHCEIIESIMSETFGTNSFPAKKGGWENGRYTCEQAAHLTKSYSDAKEAFLQTFRGQRLDLQYEDVVTHPDPFVRAIASFVGKPVTPEALSFIEPQLRHFTVLRR